MKLVKKAIIGFVAVAVVSLVGSLFVYAKAASSKSTLVKYQKSYEAAQLDSLNLITNFYIYDDQMNMYSLLASAIKGQKPLEVTTYQQAQQAHAAMSTLLTKMTAFESLEPSITPVIKRVSRDVAAYSVFAEEVNQNILAGNAPKAAFIQTLGNIAPSNDLMPALSKLHNIVTNTSAAQLKSISAAQGTAEMATGAVAVLVLLLIGLLGYFFKTAVLNPLISLRDRLRDLGSGTTDFNQKLPVTSNDEFAEIADAFNGLSARLLDAMRTIAGQVSVLGGTTSDLSVLSDDLSQTASITSERAGMVSVTADLLVSNAAAVSGATEEMRISITEIASSASKAARVASSAVDVASDASETVRRLGGSSAEVGEVVKTINGIAEQTNLLALNAAIEAARAGDAGRGFAVVASEVKDLAKDTADATQDIARRMEVIQSDTAEVVGAIGQIAEIINDINDLQSSIATAVEEQSVTTNEIGRIASEAAEGSSDAVHHIRSVVEAAESSHSGVDATRGAITKLGEIATELSELVSQFAGDASSQSSSVSYDASSWDSGPKVAKPARSRFGVDHLGSLVKRG